MQFKVESFEIKDENIVIVYFKWFIKRSITIKKMDCNMVILKKPTRGGAKYILEIFIKNPTNYIKVEEWDGYSLEQFESLVKEFNEPSV